MDNYGADGSGDANNSHRGMGRGRGRNACLPRQAAQSLRRPHGATQVTPATVPESGFDADVVKNSKLSADAAEFVPQSLTFSRGYPSNRPSSAQNRLQLARQGLSQQAFNQQRHQVQHVMHQPQVQYANHEPHGQQRYQQYRDASQYQGCNQHYGGQDFGHYDGGSGDYADKHQTSRREGNNVSLDYEGALQRLDQVMNTLTLNPGRFDSVVNRLVNSLKPYIDQPSQSQEIITMIIEQSINESNFRYSGARLCKSLAAALSSSQDGISVFKETLLSRCQEQTQSVSSVWQETTEHTDDEEKKCHGLILFLAELVIQMESSLAVSLGKLFVQLISAVLRSPAPNSAKNICQALKLSGRILENDSSSKEDMEQVMQKLTKLVTEGRVDPHVGRMVQGVNNLRSENWGNSVKSETDTNSTPASRRHNIPVRQTEPVFYGPDGNVLSAEESKFLQDIARSASELDVDIENEDAEDIFGEGGEANEGVDDDEDDMIAEAYEEFLSITNKTKR